jgi:hypothetical protein
VLDVEALKRAYDAFVKLTIKEMIHLARTNNAAPVVPQTLPTHAPIVPQLVRILSYLRVNVHNQHVMLERFRPVRSIFLNPKDIAVNVGVCMRCDWMPYRVVQFGKSRSICRAAVVKVSVKSIVHSGGMEERHEIQ